MFSNCRVSPRRFDRTKGAFRFRPCDDRMDAPPEHTPVGLARSGRADRSCLCASQLYRLHRAFATMMVAKSSILADPSTTVVVGVGKQAALVKMRKAVTVVRQMKTLGKVKKLEKAEKKLEKLKKKQVRATI